MPTKDPEKKLAKGRRRETARPAEYKTRKILRDSARHKAQYTYHPRIWMGPPKPPKKKKHNAAPVRAWVQHFKQSHPCTDCNKFFPYYVMDFDHVGPKRREISLMCSSQSLKTIQAEILHCELVCSNCHRTRTFERRMNLIIGSIPRGPLSMGPITIS
jgi:hypothetical protein